MVPHPSVHPGPFTVSMRKLADHMVPHPSVRSSSVKERGHIIVKVGKVRYIKIQATNNNVNVFVGYDEERKERCKGLCNSLSESHFRTKELSCRVKYIQTLPVKTKVKVRYTKTTSQQTILAFNLKF